MTCPGMAKESECCESRSKHRDKIRSPPASASHGPFQESYPGTTAKAARRPCSECPDGRNCRSPAARWAPPGPAAAQAPSRRQASSRPRCRRKAAATDKEGAKIPEDQLARQSAEIGESENTGGSVAYGFILSPWQCLSFFVPAMDISPPEGAHDRRLVTRLSHRSGVGTTARLRPAPSTARTPKDDVIFDTGSVIDCFAGFRGERTLPVAAPSSLARRSRICASPGLLRHCPSARSYCYRDSW